MIWIARCCGAVFCSAAVLSLLAIGVYSQHVDGASESGVGSKLKLPARRFRFVIGAMKSGTTILCEHLFQHPQIGRYHPTIDMGEPAFHDKEPTFFGSEDYDQFGIRHYWDRFAVPGTSQLLYLDCSPAYLDLLDVPKQLANSFDDHRHLKLVAILRDPVERVLSQWRHDRIVHKPGSEEYEECDGFKDFDGFVLEQMEAFDECAAQYSGPGIWPNCLWTIRSLLRKSLYDLQVQHWLSFFPSRSLCVITNEELRDDRPVAVARVCKFFGIKPIPSRVLSMTFRFSHGADTSFVRDNSTISILRSFFEKYGQQVRRLALKDPDQACVPQQ